MNGRNKGALHWDGESHMTKEYALAVIQHLKHFSNSLYHFPEKEHFSGKADFEAHMRELDGLKDYVENGSIGCG